MFIIAVFNTNTANVIYPYMSPVDIFLKIFFKHLSQVSEFVITIHIYCIGELEKGAPKVFKKR